MPTDTMLELADAVEKAERPSRELDGRIAQAMGLPHGPAGGFSNDHNGDYWTTDESAARYTASLDAAMTLIPEMTGGVEVEVNRWADGKGAVEFWVDGQNSVMAEAATPALALTAAALRAHAILENQP